MKPFAKRLLALVSAAAIALTTIPAVRGTNADLLPTAPTDQWSAPEVSAMKELVPDMIRSVSAAVPLTRQKLCSLVMDSYKFSTGLTDEDLGQPAGVFTDTDDTDVLNACRLDLFQGKTPGIFAPAGTCTREEFWTAAVKLLELLGYPCSDDRSNAAGQPLQLLLSIGAITGEGESIPDPAGIITIGEAEQILNRITICFTDWQEASMKSRLCPGENVAAFALDYVGCRYVRGGQGPNKFDCSGFVYYVYKHFGYSLKPGARNQWSMLDGTIQKAGLQLGDLVFFSRNGSSSGIFHVGIYIGNDQFVHAANSRKGLIVTDMDDDWYARRYLGAKRVID